LRVDTHLHEGDTIPPFYDSLLCKIISHEPTRDGAIARMLQGLGDLQCKGVPTTVPLHEAVIRSEDFHSGNYDTRAIPGWPPPKTETESEPRPKQEPETEQK